MSESPIDDLRLLARGWRWTRRPLVPRALEQQRSEFDTGWARTPLPRALRESLLGGALGPLLRSSLDLSVAGRERLDEIQPPVVFVANHASHLDGLLVLHALPAAWRQKTVVAAASDYFFDTWWRSVAATLVLNAVPLERFSGVRQQTQLASLLSSGWSVLAFPEGTRSRDGSLQRLHHGASQLALETRRPMVPVAIRGTFQAMPVGARWPRHTRVAVRFGPAVLPARDERTRDLTARVDGALRMLLHEDATTWWTAIRGSAANGDARGHVARWRRVWASTEPVPREGRPSVWWG
jgi:1-acyl-sn-glycerol-3-phosphate acyltransferase